MGTEPKNPKEVDWGTVELNGIDTSDYPDFCDAYIAAACWTDGTPLTDDELDTLNDDSSLIHELVFEHLY